MPGMSSTTGAHLGGLDHLRQSVRDILTTRIGTRVELRAYGSDLPRLVDRPIDDALRVDLTVATVEALRRWEPRLDVRRVAVRLGGEPGAVELDIEGLYQPEGRVIRLDGITVS